MVIIKTINPKRIGNLNCFLALAYGIVDAVSKETRPIENGTIILLKSLIWEYLIEITTMNIVKPGEGNPEKYSLLPWSPIVKLAKRIILKIAINNAEEIAIILSILYLKFISKLSSKMSTAGPLSKL